MKIKYLEFLEFFLKLNETIILQKTMMIFDKMNLERINIKNKWYLTYEYTLHSFHVIIKKDLDVGMSVSCKEFYKLFNFFFDVTRSY